MTSRAETPAERRVQGTGPVRLERAGHLARIVLVRGATGNALDLELAIALRDAVESVVKWADTSEQGGVRAVLLRAEGRNFSVGGNLKAFAARREAVGPYVHAAADAAHAAILGLVGLSVPVVAEIRGAVAGGGVGLALSADLVVAARSASLRLAYTALGLTPDCGASWLLSRALGERRALDLLLTNRVLDATEAERWGLFSRVVDDDELPSAAEELARSLAAGHVHGLSRAKQLVRAGRLEELRDHLAREADFIAEASARPETRAAMERFLSRSRPGRA